MAYAAGQHPPEDVLYLTWKDGLLNCNEDEGEKTHRGVVGTIRIS